MTPKTLQPPTAQAVAAARANIAGLVRRTPLWRLEPAADGPEIWLKLECLQPLGSFKIRAAVNALKSADPDGLQAGVITPSAGNFGLGLAYAARELQVPVTVVVPQNASTSKTSVLEDLGAHIHRVSFDAWWQAIVTRRWDGAQGAFFHPVADPAVLAGNATIGAEILEDLPDVDAVLIPFGGGGLTVGVSTAIRRSRPNARILAVESEAGQPLAAALAAGGPTQVDYRPSFVDGIGSSSVLEAMWPLISDAVDGAVKASFADIAAAIRLLAARMKIVVEGAGAAPVAAALAGRGGPGRVVCIVSGGNIAADKLSTILSGALPEVE